MTYHTAARDATSDAFIYENHLMVAPNRHKGNATTIRLIIHTDKDDTDRINLQEVR